MPLGVFPLAHAVAAMLLRNGHKISSLHLDGAAASCPSFGFDGANISILFQTSKLFRGNLRFIAQFRSIRYSYIFISLCNSCTRFVVITCTNLMISFGSSSGRMRYSSAVPSINSMRKQPCLNGLPCILSMRLACRCISSTCIRLRNGGISFLSSSVINSFNSFNSC